MKTTLYARVSTKNGQDPDNQLRSLREFCKRHKHNVIREYVDQASGASANRQEFQRLFTDARKGKFDLVVFWSLDRFSREGVLKTLQHLERLSSFGVAWKSFTEEHLDSAGDCGLYDRLVGMFFFRGHVFCLVCKPKGANRIVKAEFVPDADESTPITSDGHP